MSPASWTIGTTSASKRDVDGDAEVDAAVDDQLVVAHAGVEVVELAERVDRCPCNEGQEAETGAAPDRVDAVVVDLGGHQGVGAGGERAHHVVGRRPPGLGELDDVVVGAGLRDGGRGCARGSAGPGRSGGGWARRALAAAASTSLRVMRPPVPVPTTSSGCRPCSSSSRPHDRGEEPVLVGRWPRDPLRRGGDRPAAADAGVAVGGRGRGGRGRRRRGRPSVRGATGGGGRGRDAPPAARPRSR